MSRDTAGPWIAFLGVCLGIAACGGSAAPAPGSDSGLARDAASDGPGDAPAPDAPMSDAGADAAASAEIQAVRDAADAMPGGGTVSLPIDDVLVTYVKPAIGADPAGF